MSADLDSRLDHPAVAGLAGCLALLAVLLAPIAAGRYVAEYLILATETTQAWDMAYFVGVGSMFAGIWAFNRVLYHTAVYDWVGEFTQWAARYGIGSFNTGERA